MIIGDTIVAAATPFGYSGIAVIRLSGPEATKIINQISTQNSFNNRVATIASLKNLSGETVDQALVTCFFSPESYTGEDVVEISTHGNPAIINEVLGVATDLGARLAEPGEFTYRAFINGKMDLVQAEAVAALIHSKSEESAKIQQKILSGDLSLVLNQTRSSLINLISTLEHQMDISEEEASGELGVSFVENIDGLQTQIQSLLGTFEMGQLFNRGISVVISGAPNVGKSSLFNLIANTDRAIVSDQPGTTRDVIDVEVIISGVPVRFFDTAGIRETGDAIEKEGVGRALEKKLSADIVVLVYDDPSQKPIIRDENNKTIFVLNKLDLHHNRDNKGVIHISCVENEGVGRLFEKIKQTINIKKASADTTYLSTERQFASLSACSRFLQSSKNLLSVQPVDLELVAFELCEALGSIDVLLGKTTAEDIINNIFKSLCVGK